MSRCAAEVVEKKKTRRCRGACSEYSEYCYVHRIQHDKKINNELKDDICIICQESILKKQISIYIHGDETSVYFLELFGKPLFPGGMVTLECGHRHHATCFFSWMSSNLTCECPLCKQKSFSHFYFVNYLANLQHRAKSDLLDHCQALMEHYEHRETSLNSMNSFLTRRCSMLEEDRINYEKFLQNNNLLKTWNEYNFNKFVVGSDEDSSSKEQLPTRGTQAPEPPPPGIEDGIDNE